MPHDSVSSSEVGQQTDRLFRDGAVAHFKICGPHIIFLIISGPYSGCSGLFTHDCGALLAIKHSDKNTFFDNESTCGTIPKES